MTMTKPLIAFGGVVVAAAAACLFAASTARAELTLAREGKTSYVIVIGDDASRPERSAAGALHDYLRDVTGAEFTVSKRSDPSIKDAPKIFIESDDALRDDGISIKTAGDDLHFAGKLPRGPLYAVYTFLEDAVGVRWWTSTESNVPHKPTLTIPDQTRTYAPPFRYREVFMNDAIENPAFAARLKLNGHHNRITQDLGGHYTLIGWCHTSFDLIPPNTYFSKHPEWFALRNGKRQTASQLCLSNPEMRAELIRNALQRVRRRPDAGMISISQNDTLGPCQCDACRAIAKEEGSESGAWIRLVNEVAAAINKQYPGFLVETLAYQYTRHPPRVTRPSDHVIVRLCSIECDFAHPLSGESNQSFGDDLRGWAAIAPNLFVWNYVTNFHNYLVPHPNMTPFADDLRFFAANHVVGVFEQGDAFNKLAGDMLPLRCWLLAHLLWDPSRDQTKLRDEFLNGYYGAAGPHLGKYLDLVNAASADPKFRAYCGNNDFSYMSPQAMQQSTKLFDDAAKAVAGDAELGRRVQRERLAFTHVALMKFDLKSSPSGYRDEVRRWADEAKTLGVVNYSESQRLDAYVPAFEMRGELLHPPKIPAAGAALAPGEYDLQEGAFTLYRRPEASDIVADLKASNSKAAWMPASRTDWAVQYHFTKESPAIGAGPWIVYLLVRCDAKATRGAAFLYGIHDAATGRVVSMDRASLSIAGDGEYHAYPMPLESITPGMYVYVAPLDNPNAVSGIYVDRIFIRKQPPAREGQPN